jgi:hypothetical protein
MITRSSVLAALLLQVGVVPGVGQDASSIRTNEMSVDIGLLEGGITYARRIGRGPVSIGGGVWAAYEPWSSFEQNVYAAAGGDLFVRLHALDMAHVELGPSLLRYRREDDCSSCGGTFVGARAAVMVGKGAFWVGPTARVGWLNSGVTEGETGVLWGVQGRLLFSWGR